MITSAVEATSVLLGGNAFEHLRKLHHTVVVDAERQLDIAAAYDALEYFGPRAYGAWRALQEETMRQAQVLHSVGIHWEVVEEDPYTSAAQLFNDLRRTNTIRVLSTRITGGHPFFPDEVNDTFRAVHDILGHAATGRGFDRHGEEAAYQAHAAVFSPLARQALATETRGQNASMLRAGGVFPEQKIAILPEWAREVDVLKPRTDGAMALARLDAANDHGIGGLGDLFRD